MNLHLHTPSTTHVRPTVTKHVFCHLQTQIHSAERPRPHTHTKNHGAEGLCVRSTSQAGETSGKGLCGTKLLLNELIRHWYAKSCYKERELEAGEKGEERDDGGRGPKERDTSEIWRCFISSQKQITTGQPWKQMIWFADNFVPFGRKEYWCLALVKLLRQNDKLVNPVEQEIPFIFTKCHLVRLKIPRKIWLRMSIFLSKKGLLARQQLQRRRPKDVIKNRYDVVIILVLLLWRSIKH